MSNTLLQRFESGKTSTSPIAASGTSVSLVASAALAASNAWAASSVIAVKGARLLLLDVTYNAAATGGFVELMVALSNKPGAVTSTNPRPAPAVGDDSWFLLQTWDAVVTEVTPSGALVSGEDFTAAPGAGRMIMRDALLATDAADNASDKARKRFAVRLDGAHWAYVRYHEGGAGSVGTLAIDATLVA